MVSCVGQPPPAEIVHRLFRPLMLETNTTCAPSGDHAEPPIIRVLYNAGIVNFCRFSTEADCSLVGSVTACGTGSGCAATRELMPMTIANARRGSMTEV